MIKSVSLNNDALPIQLQLRRRYRRHQMDVVPGNVNRWLRQKKMQGSVLRILNIYPDKAQDGSGC